MKRYLKQTARVVTLADGTRAVVVDIDPPEDAPQAIKEGLARRRIANGARPCPCGAQSRLVGPNRAQRRAGAPHLRHLVVYHEADCPAGDEVLGPLVRAWLAGGDS